MNANESKMNELQRRLYVRTPGKKRQRKNPESLTPPRNKCHASSNKCLTSSNKKLLGTSASLLVTSALLIRISHYLLGNNSCATFGSLEYTGPPCAELFPVPQFWRFLLLPAPPQAAQLKRGDRFTGITFGL